MEEPKAAFFMDRGSPAGRGVVHTRRTGAMVNAGVSAAGSAAHATLAAAAQNKETGEKFFFTAGNSLVESNKNNKTRDKTQGRAQACAGAHETGRLKPLRFILFFAIVNAMARQLLKMPGT